MSNDSIKKTLLVTILLSLICSVMVSSTSVFLKDKQELNKIINVQRNILAISGLTDNAEVLTVSEVKKLFENVKPKLVDLKTGKFKKDISEKEISDYDQRAAAKNPKESHSVSRSEDIASIRRQAKVAKVYVIEKDGVLKTIILPVHGYGLWSTLYGFIALGGDINTVAGMAFYEHSETPGLGGEVDNPSWKKKWIGKEVYDGNGKAALGLIKGAVDKNNASAKYQVDGLAGATLTSNGVTNLVKFWMGDNGFGPFLKHLKKGGA
ncbi:MAG: Na(+)-translocating NADH-quinone reductase subunit C [Candidatus Endonucleobacter bathymodioli]|uniref:Na(+)-translocating NADH-quinone reductase subunit C n=1 Tax=Candidatus Endonucleibacter bathymodioli TaxID=539814 RepID=A0AA90SLK0_9GAMM|nr:Na(+)-translocating NADH-quinone reductase subunit C [Candidatus Endonucleobacter bathymodioli]